MLCHSYAKAVAGEMVKIVLRGYLLQVKFWGINGTLFQMCSRWYLPMFLLSDGPLPLFELILLVLL